MKVHYAQRDVEAVNVSETREFTMAANGKAFRIVIDGLYSDKIRAIVREIWSNAFDAHTMAGCPERPFHCTLPSRFNETFSVRDFGTGMDHHTIMNLYSRVFESTKDKDDVQVGKFGLGSKSPFAYTDTFAVSAYDGKEARMYSAYIGEDGIPRISLMGTSPSKEERGIEVSFPVQEKDRQAFVRAAEFTLLGFDVPPKLFGSSEVRLPDMTPVLSGTGWKVIKSGGNVSAGAKARQGCVVYPLDVAAVSGLTDMERAVAELNLLLDFNIGELEITANREALGYDKKTQDNVRARLNTIAEEFVKNIQTSVTNAPSMLDAYNISKTVLEGARASYSYSLTDNIRRRLKWKGRHLTDTAVVGRATFGKASTLSYEEGGLRFCQFTSSDLNRGVPGRGYGSRKTVLNFEAGTSCHVHLQRTFVVIDYVNKGTTSARHRLRHWWEKSVPTSEAISHHVLWIKVKEGSPALARLKVAMDRFKHCKVVYLHDMEKPPVDPSTSARSKVQFSIIDGSGLRKATVDLDDDHIYIHSRRGTYQRPKDWNRVLYDNDLVDLRSKLVKLGYMKADQVILVVPKTYEKVADKHSDHWVDLFKLADTAIDEHFSEQSVKDSVNSVEVLRGARDDVYRNFVNFVTRGEVDIKSDTSYASNLSRMIHKAVLARDTSANLMASAFIRQLKGGWDIPCASMFPATRAILEKAGMNLVSNYPMLALLKGYYTAPSKELRNSVLDYINLVDKERELAQSP